MPDPLWRARVVGRSARFVLYLRSLPRWVPAAVVAVVFLAGLVLPGAAGGVVLLAVAALLGWLLVLSWPALAPSGRVVRGLTIVVLMLLAGLQVLRG